MFKEKQLDSFIILLMFALLPIDMINGIMLKNGIILPVTLGQMFKLFIVGALFCRFYIHNIKLLRISCVLFLVMLMPSIYQAIIQVKTGFIFSDIVKVGKYLTPLFTFFFFRTIIKRGEPLEIKRLFKLVWFSYFVLVGNILIKYLGVGYPMYSTGSIGSKGFFFAGNETSALFIILSSILAYKIYLNKKQWTFYFFMLFNLFVGISISSKTGILGMLLLMVLIPLERPTNQFDLRKFKKLSLLLFLYIPLLFSATWLVIKQTSVYNRLTYFWDKLDFWTFLFSHRNHFFIDAYKVYQDKYSAVEKWIGVGQYKYEQLNNSKIIEIDIGDLFFANGYLGLLLFLTLWGDLAVKSWMLSKTKKHSYANFVFLMLVLLLGISSIAGHVINSGMSGVFIGFLFSLMYLKKEHNDEQ